jgi:enamine deaminase RidA (YjgF/YER057c/UK114 family)
MKRPQGFSQGTREGRTIFVAGQIGRVPETQEVSPDFAEQARQALRNIVDVLEAGGARPEHITRMTWFVVGMREYVAARKAMGVAYRELIGHHYPAMSVIGVAELLDPRARLEIEVTAVLPE